MTVLRASQASRDGDASVAELRLVVEALRRCGGMAPRALLGGRFVAGEGAATTYVAADTGPLLPAGVLTVDRAAHDVVESSQFAFRLAGSLSGLPQFVGIFGLDR